MRHESVAYGLGRDQPAVVLTDSPKWLLAEQLLEERLVAEKVAEILILSELPSHVTRGAEAAEPISDSPVDCRGEAADHHVGIESTSREVTSIRREHECTSLRFGHRVDALGRDRLVDHLHRVRTAEVEATAILLKPGHQERDHHGQL